MFMRGTGYIALLFVLLAFGCSTDGNKTTGGSSPLDTLPVLRTVSVFTGVDHKNASFSAASMKGKVWIASFFFTRCGTVCPALNTVLSGIQRDFGNKVSFVSLTSDPDYDTPAVMSEYAQQYGAKDGTWWFVTMPLDSMITVASRDLGLIEPTSPDIHSTRFVLVDSTMKVRGYYDSADTADVSKLRSVLQAL
jgi:protein SCO1/2